MILNTINRPAGTPRSSLTLLAEAGFPISTAGRETFVAVLPSRKGRLTSWGERIHLRHHPNRRVTVFADSTEEALQVLAYEFHLWEVRESFRLAKQRHTSGVGKTIASP